MTTDTDSPLQRGFFERLWDRFVPRTPVFRFLSFVRPYAPYGLRNSLSLSGSGHGVLISRGAVYRWNRHVVQPQIDGELSAMMNDMAHREAA